MPVSKRVDRGGARAGSGHGAYLSCLWCVDAFIKYETAPSTGTPHDRSLDLPRRGTWHSRPKRTSKRGRSLGLLVEVSSSVWFNVVYYIYRISSVEKHMTRCYRIHARRRNCFEPPRTLVGRRTRTDRDGICPPPRDSPIDPSQKSRLGGSRSWDFLISSRALYTN